jgi:hypothetical protein
MSEKEKQEIAQLRAQLQVQREHNNRMHSLLEEREREARSKNNHNFIQLYRNQAKELRRLGQKSGLALNLLLLFGEKMNRQNAIMISYKALQEITGKSRQSLSNAIRILQNEKFLKIIKVGTSNAYIINSEVFWTSHANLKSKLSVFNATVIATESEQEPGWVENWDKVKLKHMPLIEQDELPLEDGAPWSLDPKENEEEV